MWQKPLKKTIFTLRVDKWAADTKDQDIAEIVSMTDPLLRRYAQKIGADMFTITERKFPDFPPVYEKFQIYELAQEMGNDWNIYIDSDALVHPDMYDVTNHISKDTVCHHGKDMADQRWRYDRFFMRDGRHIGSGNWFACASDWCIELWKPLDDTEASEAIANITPIMREVHSGIEPGHLIDDYTCSRNIAKYGFKFISVRELNEQLGFKPTKLIKTLPPPDSGYIVVEQESTFFYHEYLIPVEQKVVKMKNILRGWGMEVRV